MHSIAGLPYQRNVGLDVLRRSKFSTSLKICNFIDDDVKVNPDYFLKAEEIFKSEKPAALGAFDANLPKPMSTWPRRLLGLASHESGRLLKSGIAIAPARIQEVSEVDWVAGHSVAYSWPLITKVGFNQNLRMFGEDVDACIRLREHGRILVHPEFFAFHLADPGQRETVVNAQAFSSGFRWSLATTRKGTVTKYSAMLATIALLFGGIAQALWRRDASSIALGQLKFLARLIAGRRVEQIIWRPSLQDLGSSSIRSPEVHGRLQIYPRESGY